MNVEKIIVRDFYRTMNHYWFKIEYHSWENAIDSYFERYNESPEKHKKLYKHLLKALRPLSIQQGYFVPKKGAFKVLFKEVHGVRL